MKKTFPMNLRTLLTLLAVVSLLVCLAGCNFNAASEDPTGGTETQTDPVSATDPTEELVEPSVPQETAPEPMMGTVTHDNLNVRSNPSTDSTKLRQLDINTRVVVIETRVVGDVTWGRISDGWINMDYVLLDGEEPATPNTEPVEDPTEPSSTNGTSGTITASELNIRKSNSADSASVGKYKKGDKVVILEVKGNWGRTDKGWISMKYVKTEGSTETPDIKDNDKESSTLVSDGKTTVLGYVVIDVDALNIRYGPGTKYDKAGTAKEGERYAYYQEKNGWIRIKDGWISKTYTEKDGPLTDKEASTLVTDGKTDVLGYVVIDADVLNVRYGPGTKYDKAGTVKEGERCAYYQEKSGWIRLKDGWISKAYTKAEDDKKDDTIVSDKSTTVLGYGVVTGTTLNARSGPGTDYKQIDTFELGDRVAYYQKDGKWVRTKDGWISSNYLYIEGNKGNGAGSGTITGDSLNVRTGPGTGYKSTGKLNSGDKVDILVQLKVGKTTWGYTGKGWVSMEYVKMN